MTTTPRREPVRLGAPRMPSVRPSPCLSFDRWEYRLSSEAEVAAGPTNVGYCGLWPLEMDVRLAPAQLPGGPLMARPGPSGVVRSAE